MTARIERARAALAQRGNRSAERIEPRVAASLTHGGLVNRLVSPALGCAVVCGHVVDLAPRRLWWQDRLGGPFPLSVPNAVVDGGPDDLARTLAMVVMPLVAALTDAVSAVSDVSRLVLAGNVATSINSAAMAIAARDLDLADRSFAVANQLLGDATLCTKTSAAGPEFRRHSCCLAYRLEPATRELCGDCVLR